MTSTVFARSLVAAMLGLAFASAARADIKDYEFQLLQTEVKSGDTVVAVRLVDKRTGKPVPDAVIFAKRIDMAPDEMPTMTSNIEQVASSDRGVYRFKTNLMMAGGWRLSLSAKIQGETGSLESKLVLKATP